MQLDTEDGETFVPPAGVVASPTAANAEAGDHPQDAESTDAQAAAQATSEIEE